jgi:glycosyltransferase involved in cell wall biosynthesis
VVIVDDGSTDGTTDVARGRAAELNGVRVVALERNQGKAAAVAAGFAAATEDIVVILDADLAVAPEELPAVIAIMRAGRAEFVNGSRLVYPMQPGAMKFLNYLGNKFFGIVLSLIMGQRNTDTLCGTKAFFRRYLPHMRLGAAGWATSTCCSRRPACGSRWSNGRCATGSDGVAPPRCARSGSSGACSASAGVGCATSPRSARLGLAVLLAVGLGMRLWGLD